MLLKNEILSFKVKVTYPIRGFVILFIFLNKNKL